jgi:hypothetical protein
LADSIEEQVKTNSHCYCCPDSIFRPTQLIVILKNPSPTSTKNMKNCAGCFFRTPICIIFYNIYPQGHATDQERYFKKLVGAHSGKRAAIKILSNKHISA